MQHHNYSLSDLENMIPWEREIYVDMLVTYIKEENPLIVINSNRLNPKEAAESISNKIRNI